MNTKAEKTPYPADPEPYLERLAEALPFFPREAIMTGYLAMMAAAENARQSGYIYDLAYYGGKWVHVKRRDFVWDSWSDVTSRDTRATSVSLMGAIASLREAAGGTA